METLEAQTHSLMWLWPSTGSLKLLQLSRVLWNFKYSSHSLLWLCIKPPEELEKCSGSTSRDPNCFGVGHKLRYFYKALPLCLR